MIFAKSSAHDTPPDKGHDVAVFPLAMPSIATPGAMLSVVVLTNNNTHSFLQQTATCGVMALVLALTFFWRFVSDQSRALIGRAGANVLSRVMGLILSAVAVQMIYSAFRGELGPG